MKIKIKFGELSIDQIRAGVCERLSERYGQEEGFYPYLRDIFPESQMAVFERDGRMWRVKYAVDGTMVTIGDAVEEVTQEYVPATQMADLGGNWFEIFRAGDYGDKGNFTTDDLDKIVSNYDASEHEAPLVLGHPEHDSPAYGWVEKVKRVGEVLMAKAKQVPEAFEELVKSGRFKKRSVSLYLTDKGPKLRHVGFLGAMPPEVKGLQDLKLCEFSDGKFVEFNSGEEDVDEKTIKKTVAESLKEIFSELFGGKKEPAQAAADPALVAKFNELQAKFDAQDAEIKALKSTQSQAKVSTLAEDAVKDLKAKQKWIPAFDAMGAPQIFAELAKSEATVTFGEGDKKTTKPMVQVFADFLAGLQQIVPPGEIAKGANTAKKGGKLIKFTEPTGDRDVENVELAEAAEELSRNEKITYSQALKRLRTEGFVAAREGSAAAGQV